VVEEWFGARVHSSGTCQEFLAREGVMWSRSMIFAGKGSNFSGGR